MAKKQGKRKTHKSVVKPKPRPVPSAGPQQRVLSYVNLVFTLLPVSTLLPLVWFRTELRAENETLFYVCLLTVAATYFVKKLIQFHTIGDVYVENPRLSHFGWYVFWGSFWDVIAVSIGLMPLIAYWRGTTWTESLYLTAAFGLLFTLANVVLAVVLTPYIRRQWNKYSSPPKS